MAAPRRGATLSDLMVLVLVVGVLIGLILPAIQRSYRTNSRMSCSVNFRNVGFGLQGYLNTKGHYPNAGTFREFSGTTDPANSTIRGCFTEVTGVRFLPPGQAPDAVIDFGPLRSWIVDILPFVDANDLANAWNHDRNYASEALNPSDPYNMPTNAQIARKSIGILTCPEDNTVQPGVGNLSYVVNGGFSRWVGDPTIGWQGWETSGVSTRGGPGWGIDVAARTGVMFLGSDTRRKPWDRRTTRADLRDGESQTILASENLRAGASPAARAAGGLATNWACPHPNFVQFIASDRVAERPDALDWAMANDPRRNLYTSINHGARRAMPEGSAPFPSSRHAGGAMFLFCDGSVRFIVDTIDGDVYARLITPAGSALPSQYRQAPLADDDF